MIQGDDQSGSFADGERGRSPDDREGRQKGNPTDFRQVLSKR
jgi:hypothetical protein